MLKNIHEILSAYLIDVVNLLCFDAITISKCYLLHLISGLSMQLNVENTQ